MRNFILCFTLAALAAVTTAKVVDNSLSASPPYASFLAPGGKADWVFLGKFAFAANTDPSASPPSMAITKLDTDVVSNKTQIIFYDDEKISWQHIYDNRDALSCTEKYAFSKQGMGDAPFIYQSDVPSTTNLVQKWPRYWYVAAVNCEEGLGAMDYSLHFLNAGGHWDAEFSVDDQGVIWIYVVFILLFTVYFLAACTGLWRMYNDFHPVGDLDPFKPLLMLFVLSLGLEIFAQICFISHYSDYASTGVGMPGLKIFAEVLHGMSECVMILLVVFIAKGWNINNYDFGTKVAMGVILAILYSLYVAMIVEGNLHTTMPSSIYIYDTPPGIVLNVIRLLFAFLLVMVFAYGAIKAYAGANKRAHEAQSSLMIFVFLMASWLLVAPFTAMIDTYVDPVAREKTAVSFECIGHAYGAGILLFILWPGRIHEYFSVSGTALSAGIAEHEYSQGTGDASHL